MSRNANNGKATHHGHGGVPKASLTSLAIHELGAQEGNVGIAQVRRIVDVGRAIRHGERVHAMACFGKDVGLTEGALRIVEVAGGTVELTRHDGVVVLNLARVDLLAELVVVVDGSAVLHDGPKDRVAKGVDAKGLNRMRIEPDARKDELWILLVVRDVHAIEPALCVANSRQLLAFLLARLFVNGGKVGAVLPGNELGGLKGGGVIARHKARLLDGANDRHVKDVLPPHPNKDGVRNVTTKELKQMPLAPVAAGLLGEVLSR